MGVILFLLVFSTYSHVLYCKQLHQPEPSLVYPAFLEGRGLSGSRVLKINEDITLNLKKSSVLADEFLVRSYVDGVLKHTYMDGSYLEEDLFHDEDAMASVTISDEEGLQVEGMIGNKLRIMPALEQERSSDGRVAHWLHEIPYAHEGLHNDYVMPEGSYHNVTERAEKFDVYKVPKIYPELFVIVDSVFRHQFKTETEMLKYLWRTFNAVNLRYLSIDHPKVQFRFSGIEILTPAKERFLKFKTNVHNGIDGVQSVYNLKDLVNKYKKDYSAYDIVYMVTGRDMYVQEDNSNMGFAFVAAVCGERKVGLGEDKAHTYIGVRVMTHEIGHVMGCPHDGDPGPPEFGGPGSRECPFADGYLMSYNTDNLNQFRFSKCCNYLMSLMSWSPLGKCLHEKNAKSTLDQLTKKLPGEVVSRTTQCKKGFPELYDTYYMKNLAIRNCEMQCFMPKRVYGYDTHLGLYVTDGTPCNDNGYVCINGNCRTKQKKYEY